MQKSKDTCRSARALTHLSNTCHRIRFDDLHSTGLYTWPFLYTLGSSKLSRAKAYIRQLRERGLSRDPPAPRRGAAAAALKQTRPAPAAPSAAPAGTNATAPERKQGT